MTRIVFIVLAAALTLASGCKKHGSEEAAGSAAAPMGSATAAGSGNSPTAGSGSAAGSDGSAATAAAAGAGSAAGSGAPAAGSGDSAAMAAGGSAGAEAMAHRAGMCPSTVLGATTKAAVKGKAVVVTIESADKDAIASIQKRTDKLLAEKKGSSSTGNAHDQKGTHGGSQGLCPVYVPEGATATAAHKAKGVAVTITPKDKPDELAKEVSGRIAKAADWVKANVKEGDKGNQGAVGGGVGKDGSNHSGKGDGKGQERKKGGGKGTGGGGGGGTGGGDKHG